MSDVRGDHVHVYGEAMSHSLPSSTGSFDDEVAEESEVATKQLSMCETPRDVAWEKRRRQMLRQGRMAARISSLWHEYPDDKINQDLNELKGCIDLGFGFKEEDRQLLANALPALDIYYAVNLPWTALVQRQRAPVHSSSSLPSGKRSTSEWESWTICNPGDDPQQVKTKLRHWAHAVACSVRQSL